MQTVTLKIKLLSLNKGMVSALGQRGRITEAIQAGGLVSLSNLAKHGKSHGDQQQGAIITATLQAHNI